MLTPQITGSLLYAAVLRIELKCTQEGQQKLWGHLEVLFSSLKSHPAKFDQKTGYVGPREVFRRPKRVRVSVGAVGLLEVYVW